MCNNLNETIWWAEIPFIQWRTYFGVWYKIPLFQYCPKGYYSEKFSVIAFVDWPLHTQIFRKWLGNKELCAFCSSVFRVALAKGCTISRLSGTLPSQYWSNPEREIFRQGFWTGNASYKSFSEDWFCFNQSYQCNYDGDWQVLSGEFNFELLGNSNKESQ